MTNFANETEFGLFAGLATDYRPIF